MRWLKDRAEGYLIDHNYDTQAWTLEHMNKIPQQRNGFDCGMFVINFCDFLSDDLELTFSQSNMEEFRLKTVLRIINGDLGYPL